MGLDDQQKEEMMELALIFIVGIFLSGFFRAAG